MPLSAVIVLYRRTLSETETFRSLDAALLVAGISGGDFELTVWDNSPEPQTPPEWRCRISYYHDRTNGGLVPGFNRAGADGDAVGSEWLLLLDQDTHLPENFFLAFLAAKEWIQPRTVAIVPHVRANQKIVSPTRVVHDIVGLTIVDSSFQGIRDEETSTINSGSFVRLAFLREISGYPEHYRLDAVDMWFFSEVYERNRNVYVMPITIEQNLSVMNIAGITLDRWQSIVKAESDYYAEKRSRSAQLVMSFLASRRAAAVLLTERAPLHAWVASIQAGRLFLRAMTGRGRR